MTGDLVIDGLPYPILVADDAATTLPPLMRGGETSAFVVYDKRVEQRAFAIADGLRSAAVTVRGTCPLSGGETVKRYTTVASLFDAFIEASVDRATTIVAVGGGTVTDVAGFAAATYLRGVPWVVVPTTILGMVDAAVGGKTGINLPQGKNLVGAFWQPSAVVADITSLPLLSARERATGLVEAVKCAIIGDPRLLDAIEALPRRAKPADWKPIVAAAVRLKARVVAADPREAGSRAVLNLGHTVGHAIEVASNYAVSHGAAVAVGLRCAGLIARARDWWPAEHHARVLRVMHELGMRLETEGLTADAVMKGMTRDKKSVDGEQRFVLPVKIGEVRFGETVPRHVVRAAVEACLLPPAQTEWSR